MENKELFIKKFEYLQYLTSIIYKSIIGKNWDVAMITNFNILYMNIKLYVPEYEYDQILIAFDEFQEIYGHHSEEYMTIKREDRINKVLGG